MHTSQHLSVAALCLALFSLPRSMAQTTTTATVEITTTATVTTTGTPTPTVEPSIGEFIYVGCYNETTSNPNAGDVRALSANSTASDSETVAICITYCDRLQYGWAGLEYGRECYCGPNLNTNAEKLDESKCNIPCMGDDTQLCGGLLALSVYRRNASDSTSDAVSLSRRTNTLFGLVLGSLLAFGGLSLGML